MKVMSLNCPSCGVPLGEIKPNVQFNCPACGSALILSDLGGAIPVICPKCGAENVAQNRYCCGCGEILQVTCPSCTAVNEAEAEYCIQCGEKLSVALARNKLWLEEKRKQDEERAEAWRHAQEENQQAELERLLTDLDEPENHPLAIYSLKQYGPEAVDALLPLLKDSDPDARYGAAHTLGLIGDRRAIPELTEALQDLNGDVRFWAVNALGNLGAKESVEAISRLLKDPDRTVQREAYRTLNRIGTPAALQAIQAAKRISFWPFG